MANKVKLYGAWPSALSKRVEIALKMKGVEYVYFEEDLRNKSPDLLNYNPVYKKIPVLVHDNKAIAESQVILEYIDETWDSVKPILPRSPQERAVARFWARFLDEKLGQSIMKALWLGEEKAMHEVLENMEILEKEVKGMRFFGGESIGFVDIVADYIAYWLPAFQEAMGKAVLTKEAFPFLWEWREEFLNCSIMEGLLPPHEKLVAFYCNHDSRPMRQSSPSS